MLGARGQDWSCQPLLLRASGVILRKSRDRTYRYQETNPFLLVLDEPPSLHPLMVCPAIFFRPGSSRHLTKASRIWPRWPWSSRGNPNSTRNSCRSSNSSHCTERAPLPPLLTLITTREPRLLPSFHLTMEVVTTQVLSGHVVKEVAEPEQPAPPIEPRWVSVV